MSKRDEAMERRETRASERLAEAVPDFGDKKFDIHLHPRDRRGKWRETFTGSGQHHLHVAGKHVATITTATEKGQNTFHVKNVAGPGVKNASASSLQRAKEIAHGMAGVKHENVQGHDKSPASPQAGAPAVGSPAAAAALAPKTGGGEHGDWRDPHHNTGYTAAEYAQHAAQDQKFYASAVQALAAGPDHMSTKPSVGGPKITKHAGSYYVEHHDNVDANLPLWKSGKVPILAGKFKTAAAAGKAAAAMDTKDYMAGRRAEREAAGLAQGQGGGGPSASSVAPGAPGAPGVPGGAPGGNAPGQDPHGHGADLSKLTDQQLSARLAAAKATAPNDPRGYQEGMRIQEEQKKRLGVAAQPPGMKVGNIVEHKGEMKTIAGVTTAGVEFHDGTKAPFSQVTLPTKAPNSEAKLKGHGPGGKPIHENPDGSIVGAKPAAAPAAKPAAAAGKGPGKSPLSAADHTALMGHVKNAQTAAKAGINDKKSTTPKPDRIGKLTQAKYAQGALNELQRSGKMGGPQHDALKAVAGDHPAFAKIKPEHVRGKGGQTAPTAAPKLQPKGGSASDPSKMSDGDLQAAIDLTTKKGHTEAAGALQAEKRKREFAAKGAAATKPKAGKPAHNPATTALPFFPNDHKDTGYSASEHAAKVESATKYHQSWAKHLADSPKTDVSVGGALNAKITKTGGGDTGKPALFHVEGTNDYAAGLLDWRKGNVPAHARTYATPDAAGTAAGILDTHDEMNRRREMNAGIAKLAKDSAPPPTAANAEAKIPGAGAVVNGKAGRWVKLNGKQTHIPHHEDFSRTVGSDTFTSPAGGTTVYKNDSPYSASKQDKLGAKNSAQGAAGLPTPYVMDKQGNAVPNPSKDLVKDLPLSNYSDQQLQAKHDAVVGILATKQSRAMQAQLNARLDTYKAELAKRKGASGAGKPASWEVSNPETPAVVKDMSKPLRSYLGDALHRFDDRSSTPSGGGFGAYTHDEMVQAVTDSKPSDAVGKATRAAILKELAQGAPKPSGPSGSSGPSQDVQPHLASSPGRSSAGRLRNFGAMSDANLSYTLSAQQEHNKSASAYDPAAENALRAELKKRGLDAGPAPMKPTGLTPAQTAGTPQASAPSSGPIPNYDHVNLTLGGGAGGTTGAKIATAPDGKKYLVKQYGGNQDRVATELAANAVYRALGAKVADAGVKDINGKPALAYPLLDGEPHKINAPSAEIGKHFMADALLANWDFVGLVDDNILWDKKGQPFRVDQGGTFQYRAQGGSKDFGPVPAEVWSMMTGGGQGVGKVQVTHDQKMQQAQQIHDSLTPQKIDAIMAAAPFANDQMRQQNAEALKARVAWMGDYAKGQKDDPSVGYKAPAGGAPAAANPDNLTQALKGELAAAGQPAPSNVAKVTPQEITLGVTPTAPGLPGKPTLRPELNSPARSPVGRLRNFQSMSTDKLTQTLVDTTAHGNDPEAMQALQHEAAKRLGVQIPALTASLAPAPATAAPSAPSAPKTRPWAVAGTPNSAPAAPSAPAAAQAAGQAAARAGVVAAPSGGKAVETYQPQGPALDPNFIGSPGRSGVGRLRNFKQMSDSKLNTTEMQLDDYRQNHENDYDAENMVAAEINRRINAGTYTYSITPRSVGGKTQQATFTDQKRQKLADKGCALPDGSFPIENGAQLSDAIHAVGRAKDIGRAKAHIKKRAKALGLESKLPTSWKVQEATDMGDRDAAMARRVARRLSLIEAADSMAKASTPEPFSKSKTSNWVARGGGLPAYIQHIAHDLVEKRGMPESKAIAMAIGIVKRWARGGGKVDAGTRAAASKAVAEWEKLKAGAHANPKG